eukprot:scaffold34640_cov143-Amphora_coffeaeformis.AAC.4
MAPTRGSGGCTQMITIIKYLAVYKRMERALLLRVTDPKHDDVRMKQYGIFMRIPMRTGFFLFQRSTTSTNKK